MSSRSLRAGTATATVSTAGRTAATRGVGRGERRRRRATTVRRGGPIMGRSEPTCRPPCTPSTGSSAVRRRRRARPIAHRLGTREGTNQTVDYPITTSGDPTRQPQDRPTRRRLHRQETDLRYRLLGVSSPRPGSVLRAHGPPEHSTIEVETLPAIVAGAARGRGGETEALETQVELSAPHHRRAAATARAANAPSPDWEPRPGGERNADP